MNKIFLSIVLSFCVIVGAAQQYCSSSPNPSTIYTSQASSVIEEIILMGDALNIINNTAGQSDLYEDYTSIYSSDVTEGLSYSVDVTLGSMGSPGSTSNFAGGKVFIDFNIDGDFDDAGEDIGIIAYGENSFASIGFTVPNTGAYGVTRMRVVAQYRSDANSNNIGPCDAPITGSTDEPWYGATEDYAIVLNSACNKSIEQSVSTFLPDPLYGYMQWSYDTLTITSTSNCDINIRPEFIISHQDSAIDQGDLTIKWQVDGMTNWPEIPYNIDTNGNAYGFWNITPTNITGYNLAVGVSQPVIIKVRYTNAANNPNSPNLAPFGTYNAAWTTFEVDNAGNKIQALAPTDSVSLSLVNCNLFTINNESSSDISCYGFNDGAATISSINNGSGSYSYAWSNNEITQTVSNLQAGNYSCTVTDNNWSSCSATTSFIITEPDTLLVDTIISHLMCYGDSNGVAVLNITGGTSPYNESWIGSSPYDLQAGVHYYTVVDDNGCTFSDSVIINEPPAITSNVSTTDVTTCASQDGSIDLTVNGGVGSYSYLWSNNEATEDLTNLSGGNYSVTITDLNNCTAFDSATINGFINTLSIDSLVSPTYNGYNILCAGDSNGSIIPNISGGSGSISYAWSNSQILANVSNLVAGTYILTVSDTLGCVASDTLTLVEPNPITSNFTTTNINCYGINDGAAIVNFFGGATGTTLGDVNYILGWDTLSYPLYFPNTTFTTAALGVGVPAGVYIYSATDLNGCTHSDIITITQPDSLYTAYTLTDYNGYNVACNGDNSATVDVQINGGTSPFTHYFNGNIINNNPIQNLGSGIFTDSIIDANGCVYSDNLTITEPTPINATLTSNDISCFNYCDGEIQASVSGGITPYNYNWNTTNNIDSLCVGSYTVLITDNNGCDTNLSISISEPNAILHTIDSLINISAYGGNNGLINISAFGGSGNLNISWNGPNGFSSTSEDISNLIAGAYYIIITDSNGCIITDSIVLTQPSSLSVSLTADSDVSCNGLCDGSIDITANGGDSLYSYLWTGPNGFSSTNEDLNGLCSGTYYLALSDSTNTINYSFIINEPLALFSFLTADTITCYNGFSIAEILVYGGTSPFGYNWSNGATNYFTNLYEGFHTVEVTDSNGCILLDTINLSNPDSISLQSAISDVSCYGLQDAVVGINVTNGGTAPYLYSANNGINNQPLSVFYNVGAGSYTYLVSDANGCSNEINLTVNQPDSFYSSFSLTNASCYGECDGNAIATISGGTSPYTQDWGSAISSALCAGYYNVTITDFNGCIITDGVTILEPNPIIVNIWQNGINIEATAGFSSYQWYDNAGNAIIGATTNIFIPTIQGEYYVQVTDLNGCSTNSYSILFIIEIIDVINENNLSVNIYPNPTNGKLIIKCSKDYNTILVFNILGNTVYQFDNRFEKQTVKTIDLSSFNKGIYFVQIEVNNQLIKHRIILQ